MFEPTSKYVAPLSDGVHPLVDDVTPEKYIIPSAVLTIGSADSKLDGNG